MTAKSDEEERGSLTLELVTLFVVALSIVLLLATRYWGSLILPTPLVFLLIQDRRGKL